MRTLIRSFHAALAHVLLRAVKMNLANEGLEARKKEEEIAARKRKAEEDKVWEGASVFFLSRRFIHANDRAIQ